MKLNKKTPNNALIWTIILLIFGTIFGISTWGLAYRNESINQPNNSPRKTQEAPKKEQRPDQILLPGAKPINKISGDNTSDSHLWRLVNKTHPFKNLNYRPTNLELATVFSRNDKSNDERSVRTDIMPMLEELFKNANKAGHDLEIGSGFRSHNLQRVYYEAYSRNYGQAEADKFSAKPGYSEHQTGLVVDIATTDRHCYLDECFGNTGAGKWLAQHAHEYGFILRYPKGKEAITDFIYEPWHFRYVGKDLAGALKESDLTLEEAANYLNGRH